MKDLDKIKQISNNFTIYDGHIIVKSFENDKLIIDSYNNKLRLDGLIVDFHKMTFRECLDKLIMIKDIQYNKDSYKVEKIGVSKKGGGNCYAYIIY